MPRSERSLRVAALVAAFVAAVAVACAPAAVAPPAAAAPRSLAAGPVPAAPPAEWQGLIGEYEARDLTRIVLEQDGRLAIADSVHVLAPLAESDTVRFERDASGRAAVLHLGDRTLARRDIEPRPGTNQLRVTPVRPVETLRAEALAASPPAERPAVRAPELVELVKLDSTIRLEIRYATTNNFLGTRFYDEPRAFMQRPAAEAVVRANQSLRQLGYGLLVHDAYRPWYVTKMFWDATPPDKRWLVANPANGSNHNRGAAVDLTLFDLTTGQPVEMPSTYDESTDRAFADYPGGTSRQRWFRALLRRAMEAQGFIQNPKEWWHYDFRTWRDYPIGNVGFEKL